MLEFTPAKRFRDLLAEGQAAGVMRLSGWTVTDGQRTNLSVKFPAPTKGTEVLSPVYDDGTPVVRGITLRNPDADLDCVRVTPEGVPEETLTAPDGSAVPSSSTCCWVAFHVGTATLEVDNISEGRVKESGIFKDADIASEISLTPPIDPFGGRVAGLGGAVVSGPTAKMIEAAERRRATRQAAAATSADVAF